MSKSFLEKVQSVHASGLYSCAGLDPVTEKVPTHLQPDGALQHRAGRFTVGTTWQKFLFELIDTAAPYAGAFKPNWAFFLTLGGDGIYLLEDVCEHIRQVAPNSLLILDMKIGDIANTNAGYSDFVFDRLGADAVTVHPYLGYEAMGPLLSDADKGVFVLCRTSNPGGSEFQNLAIAGERAPSGERMELYKKVARNVAGSWNRLGNCGLVAGATAPEELLYIRTLAPRLPILIPGVGAQGGDLNAAVHAATFCGREAPFFINQSRSFLYASSGSDFAEAGANVLKRTNEEIAAILEEM